MSEKKRIALFTSSIRGYWLLRFLLNPEVQSYFRIEVVGVATDDPTQSYCNSEKRGVWKYGYDEHFEPNLVPRYCLRHEIPCFTYSIKSNQFTELYLESWKPDLALVNVFGQRLTPEVFNYAKFGTFNFHTTAGNLWPSFPGPDPLKEIQRAGFNSCRIACHRVEEKIDTGELYGFSDEVNIPVGSTVSDMQLKLAAEVVCFLRKELPNLIAGKSSKKAVNFSNSRVMPQNYPSNPGKQNLLYPLLGALTEEKR